MPDQSEVLQPTISVYAGPEPFAPRFLGEGKANTLWRRLRNHIAIDLRTEFVTPDLRWYRHWVYDPAVCGFFPVVWAPRLIPGAQTRLTYEQFTQAYDLF